jgi:hypothetical protein
MEAFTAVWRELGDDAAGVGRVDLDAECLYLDGRRRGHRVHRVLPLAQISGARRGYSELERIGGRSTLVLELTGRRPLLISSVFGIGLLAELADCLSLA